MIKSNQVVVPWVFFSSSVKQFTNRELELLPLLLENKSYQEISETLHISVGTVKAHNHNIYSKTDVSNRNELIECYQSFSMVYVAEHHDVEIQQVAYSN